MWNVTKYDAIIEANCLLHLKHYNIAIKINIFNYFCVDTYIIYCCQLPPYLASSLFPFCFTNSYLQLPLEQAELNIFYIYTIHQRAPQIHVKGTP